MDIATAKAYEKIKKKIIMGQEINDSDFIFLKMHLDLFENFKFIKIRRRINKWHTLK